MSKPRLTKAQRRVFLEVARCEYKPDSRNYWPVNTLLSLGPIRLRWSGFRITDGKYLGCSLELTHAGEIAYMLYREGMP